MMNAITKGTVKPRTWADKNTMTSNAATKLASHSSRLTDSGIGSRCSSRVGFSERGVDMTRA